MASYNHDNHNETSTIIVQLTNGQYTVGATKNIQRFLQEKRKKCNKGFYNSKNAQSAKIVFAISGDYAEKIKSFGIAAFVRMFEKYDPLNDAINQIIYP